MTGFRVSVFSFQFASAALAAAVASAEVPLAVPVSGEPFRVELVAADDNWRLTFRADQQQRAMSAAELVCWGQCPEQGRAGGLVLADGSWLCAEVAAADKDNLTADSDVFGTLKIGLDSVLGVIFRAISNQADRDRLFDRISPRPGTTKWSAGEGQGVRAAAGQVGSLSHDRLLLDNGDELTGQLVGIADGTVKFQTDVGPIDVKIELATAIIFSLAPKHRPAAQEASLRAWAGFRDGSRLLATQLVIEGDSLHITTSGQPLAASHNSLVFLQPLGGRVVYLSDLKPAEYRQTPYLDLPWPYRPDRNVVGGFLRCGGRLYLKGLGVHSAARLQYVLDQPYKRFAAELGIDDCTEGQGSVRFRVLVDGQEKFASPIVRGGDPPLPVSVDITGAKKLELLVDYADCADVFDRADWLNARLIK